MRITEGKRRRKEKEEELWQRNAFNVFVKDLPQCLSV